MGSLADGQLQTSKSTIYTVEARAGMRLNQINLFNDNAVAQTIILYIKRKGCGSRKLRQWVLNQNEAGTFLSAGEHFSISVDDALEAETTTASAVDYLVTGDPR